MSDKNSGRAFALILLAASLVMTSGCETVSASLKFYQAGRNLDTGVMDYRLYDHASGKLQYHFVPLTCFDKAKPDKQCHNVFLDASRKAKAGDSISINLLYGYICDFYEWANSPQELGKRYRKWAPKDKESQPCEADSDNRAGTRGEVAVLATAFERGTSNPIKFSEDGTVESRARVIYYSDDVRETGQPLNLSNLPIYGPVSYTGKPFFVRMYAVELDEAEVRATGAILRSLASLGAKSYAPASPVLAALTKVGEGFLQSQQDDTVAQYDLVLDGADAQGTVIAPLVSGVTAFVRLQDRNEKFRWEKYCVQLTTGRMFEKKSEDAPAENCGLQDARELSGYTYFTVNVKRNESALEQDVFQTFQEFRTKPAGGSELQPATAQGLSELSDAVDLTTRFNNARVLIANLSSASEVLKRQAREAFLAAVCPTAADKPSSAITGDRLFYLAHRAEEDANVSINIDEVRRAEGACKTRSTDWSTTDRIFAAKPRTDVAAAR